MRVRLTVIGDDESTEALRYDPASFRVGGDGKPVRIRRGPATVIGDANRNAVATGRAGGREGAVGRPESQETSLRPPSRSPRGKGGPSHETYWNPRRCRCAGSGRRGPRRAGAGRRGESVAPRRRREQDPA